MDEQNAQTKRIEQFMTQIKQRNRRARIETLVYFIIVLLIQFVYCFLMDYELIVSEGLLMTISWGIMLGMLSVFCGAFYTSQYTFVESKDRKTDEPFTESVLRMPFSMEDYFNEIHKRLIKKEILIGLMVWLCYVAGMFSRPNSGEGIVICAPEHPGKGIIISATGTLYVVLCMTIGYAIMKGIIYIRYHNRMKGNETG